MATLQDAVSAVSGVTWLSAAPIAPYVGAAWDDSETGLRVIIEVSGSTQKPLESAVVTAALSTVPTYAGASVVEDAQEFSGRTARVGAWAPVPSGALEDGTVVFADLAADVAPGIAADAALTATYAQSLVPTATKTTDYPSVARDLVNVNTTSGNVAVTLPAGAALGTRIGVRRMDASASTLTVQRAGSDVIASGLTTATSVTLVLQDRVVVFQSNGAGTWTTIEGYQALAAMDARYAAKADVQTFTSSGTWTKPAGATSVEVILFGGSGGGGSGRRGAAGTNRFGGGAGGPATRTSVVLPASQFAATSTVTIGSTGLGGAAQTADDTDGIAGTSGGATIVTLANSVTIRAAGGAGGGGGTATTGTGGGGGAGNGTAGAGGTGSTPLNNVGCGGGGGGGVNTSNAFGAGGVAFGPADIHTYNGVAGGNTDGANGTTATSQPRAVGMVGMPGGGGAGSVAGPGGTGGNATGNGSGGGGGGASTNGNNSGAGGNGDPGIAIFITSF